MKPAEPVTTMALASSRGLGALLVVEGLLAFAPVAVLGAAIGRSNTASRSKAGRRAPAWSAAARWAALSRHPCSRKTAMPDSSSRSRRAFLAGAGAVAVAGLAGCVVVPYGRGRYASRDDGRYDNRGPERGDDGPVVEVAPPPPQVEIVPVAPGPAYLWIGGYWGWNLGRHVWIGGRWALPPGRGYAWVPGAWNRHGPGWRYRGGYWGRG